MALEPARTLHDADQANPGFVRALGPATEDQLRAAERRLALPYRRFLLESGAVEVGTRLVYGIGNTLETIGGLNVVWHTEQARVHRRLDQTWLVLSSWDDLTLELAKVVGDSGQAIDGPVIECSVEGTGEQLAHSFAARRRDPFRRSRALRPSARRSCEAAGQLRAGSVTVLHAPANSTGKDAP